MRAIEGDPRCDIPERWWEGRAPGISAMLRVKNEGAWLPYALASIVEWCDEVAVFVQGAQADATWEIARDWARRRDHMRAEWYPHDSRPNGPGHGAQPRGSMHERAWFYNWCLARTRHQWVVKWDGDMVAFDWLGARLRRVIERTAAEVIRFPGVDIVGPELAHRNARGAGQEARLFRAREGLQFETGPMCEVLAGWRGDDSAVVEEPCYLHFKWAKPLDHATQAWPNDWREIEHFRRVAARARPAARYDGEVPSVLRGVMP